METKKVLVGMFDDDAVFLNAIKTMRSDGIIIDDVIMPFPVHGFEEALGMKESRLHEVGFWFGTFGLLFALGFIALSSMELVPGWSWPNNWGGKPHDGLLAWIPITFEFTVLNAAVSMFFTFIIRNTLFPGKQPIVIDERLTSHIFAILFDPNKLGDIEEAQIQQVLTENGAIEYREAITEKSRLLKIR